VEIRSKDKEWTAIESREDIKGKAIEKSCTSKTTSSIKTTGINLEAGEASGARGGMRLCKINFNIRNLGWLASILASVLKVVIWRLEISRYTANGQHFPRLL
jgi:hypothetical protein